MDATEAKGNLINSYLNQQLAACEGGALQQVELPDNVLLEEFKNQVRMWIEVDNTVKKLKAILKDRNAAKKQLSDKILRFMAKFNIEDLNTKDGHKLRYKVTETKSTPSKSEIRERLVENYGKVSDIEELSKLVFESKETRKKEVLRRLKGPNAIML